MSIDALFGSRPLHVIKLGLDAFATRGRVIANNIANAGTPAFGAKRVAFEEDLRDALAHESSIHEERSTPGHMPIGHGELDGIRPKIIPSEDPRGEGEPNNVVIEREMADLAQNQLLYDFAAQRAAATYKTLKAAIRGTAK